MPICGNGLRNIWDFSTSSIKFTVVLLCYLKNSLAIQTIGQSLNNVAISNLLQISLNDILILKFGADGGSPYQVMPSADTGTPDYSYFCSSSQATVCPASLFRPVGTWPAGRQSQCFQSSSNTAGLFLFQPTFDQAGTSYSTCVEIYTGQINPLLTCANISVVAPRPLFSNVSINNIPAAQTGWLTIETAAGCQTTISFAAIDNRVCSSPGCTLDPSPSAAPGSATCSSSSWEQQQCTVRCGRLKARASPPPHSTQLLI